MEDLNNLIHKKKKSMQKKKKQLSTEQLTIVTRSSSAHPTTVDEALAYCQQIKLISEDFTIRGKNMRAWYAKRCIELGVDRFVVLAKQAHNAPHRAGGSPAKLFSWLIKNTRKG